MAPFPGASEKGLTGLVWTVRLSLAGSVGAWSITQMAVAHEPCERGWEGQQPEQGCWANPGRVHF